MRKTLTLLAPMALLAGCMSGPDYAGPPQLATDAGNAFVRAGPEIDPLAPIAGDWWTLPEMAAGGLWTTAEDLAQFAIAVNRAWSGADGALLSQALARRMLTAGLGGYGLGFVVDTVDNELRYSHTGSNNGYRAIIVGYPARGSAIVILTNSDGGADLRAELVRSAVAAYGWPGDKTAHRAADASANPVLGDYTGTFRYSPGFASVFAVRDGMLMAQLNDGTPVRLYSEQRATFFSLDGTTYRFERDSSGVVSSVKAAFLDGTTLPARRVAR